MVSNYIYDHLIGGSWWVPEWLEPLLVPDRTLSSSGIDIVQWAGGNGACASAESLNPKLAHTYIYICFIYIYTHTYIHRNSYLFYMYIYIYIYIFVSYIYIVFGAKEWNHSHISIDWFLWEKVQETPMIFMGKSMVSGSDFPVSQPIEHSD